MNLGLKIRYSAVLILVSLDLIHESCNFLLLSLDIHDSTLHKTYF